MNSRTSQNSFACNSNEGFSLIEVIVALAILTIGILAVNAMQTVSIRGNSTANGITTSSNWATDRIEQIFGMDYEDLIDTDGDLAAGLDDKKPTVAADTSTADYTWTSPDTNYTILWNVAEEFPMPNIRTIHIIVNRNDRDTQKSVTLRYKKARFM